MPRDDSIGYIEASTAFDFQITGETARVTPAVPTYLKEVYTWAYLNPVALAIFDCQPVVSAILWGNYRRLLQSVLSEVRPGARTLQLAAVYGPFSKRILAALGTKGSLDVVEVAPIQVDMTRKKLAEYANAKVICGDAAAPPDGLYDLVISFFLLHEVPEDYKARIVDAALARLAPGGKVVFIDYAKPVGWHPMRPIMVKVFDWLEPFARILWSREISSYAGPRGAEVTWRRESYFGGLYQKVVAERIA